MKSYKLLDFYFQGQFHEGLMHGKGSYTWADGVTYEVCHSYSICNKNILCQICNDVVPFPYFVYAIYCIKLTVTMYVT